MPWTEYHWHFDGFLHGGQDFELGLLAIITIFSLILVLSRHRRQRVASVFALLRLLPPALQAGGRAAGMSACALGAVSHAIPVVWSAPVIYNSPIQI
jgi:hypothetical protein